MHGGRAVALGVFDCRVHFYPGQHLDLTTYLSHYRGGGSRVRYPNIGAGIDLHGAFDLYFLRQIENAVLILVFVVLGFLIHSDARFLLQLTMWDVMPVHEY